MIRLIPVMVLLTACGSGDPGSSCHTQKTEEGARVWCDDGSEAILTDGSNGTDGQNGSDGSDGRGGAEGPAGSDGSDGQDGMDGRDGAEGPQGEKGDPATATRVAERFSCGLLLERTAFTYQYDALLWSSGDLLVTGSISNLAVTSSQTVLYSPTQEGYLTGGVDITFDPGAEPEGRWFRLTLDRESLTSVVAYHESDGSLYRKWTTKSGVCTHETY